MIESLETRRLFSKIPLLLYPAPAPVASDALSIINATPAEVVTSAAGHVGSGQAPTQAMLDVIEYHEGYSLSIYPDSSGVPTVGVGLKLTGGNSATAAAALNSSGASFSTLVQDWNSIKSLWVSQHHPLGSLRDTSPLWAQFVEQNPSVADPLLTSSQASTAFLFAVSSKLATMADLVNNLVLSGFSVLDRDPQIALVDLAYEDASAAQYQSIISSVAGGGKYGSVHLTSNFSAAAVKIRPALLGSAQRARDDRALVRYGNDASSITVYEPTFTSFVKQTVSLVEDAVPVNAFGQTIILPLNIRSVSDPGIVSVKNDGLSGPLIRGLRVGTTDLTLFTGPASAGIVVAVSLPSLTLQTSGTKPDIDGSFSGRESIIINSYEAGAFYELLQLSGSVNSEGMKPKRLSVFLEISSNPDDELGINEGIHYGGDELPSYVLIRIGSDRWKSASAYVTAYDYINNSIAVTFSAGPNDSSGKPGTISGSFVGFFSLIEHKLY